MWGFNDKSQLISNFAQLPKNHHLAADSLMVERDLKTLRWFSDGYYNVIEDPKTNALYLNDLRFGLTSEEDKGLESYIFTWKLAPNPTQPGRMSAYQYQEPRGDVNKAFSELMTRIKGK